MTGKPESTDEAQLHAAVGRDLRALRRLRGMTIATLAEKTGRSVGFISQIERGVSQVSVRDLQLLTRVLDVPLSWFFINQPAPAPERGYVVRAASRRQVGSREDGLLEELLSPDLGGSFEIFRSSFQPGAEMPVAQRRNTEEAGFIVTGEFDLWLDEEHFRLTEGDSFRFSGEHYRWRNPGSTETVIIWVISPPVY